MAEALTRKQVIQAVWNKFKAIIGNKDISGRQYGINSRRLLEIKIFPVLVMGQ